MNINISQVDNGFIIRSYTSDKSDKYLVREGKTGQGLVGGLDAGPVEKTHVTLTWEGVMEVLIQMDPYRGKTPAPLRGKPSEELDPDAP